MSGESKGPQVEEREVLPEWANAQAASGVSTRFWQQVVSLSEKMFAAPRIFLFWVESTREPSSALRHRPRFRIRILSEGPFQ